jgi:hypothetical protein
MTTVDQCHFVHISRNLEAGTLSLMQSRRSRKQRAAIFWGMARNFDIDDIGFTGRFKKQQGEVFLEDVAILVAQQKSIAANPDLPLCAFNIDEGGTRARIMISMLLKQEALG